MSKIPEKCATCIHFDYSDGLGCKRVIKMKLVVGHGGGSIELETRPGIIPHELEGEFVTWVSDAVDAWPGWKDVFDLLRDYVNEQEGCAAKQETPFRRLPLRLA